MKRRPLVLGGILLAALLGLIAMAMILERRPNPILVTVRSSSEDGTEDPLSMQTSPGNGRPSLEVEVARERPVPMAVTDGLVRGPGGVPGSLPMADSTAVAAEMAELRAALKSWAAAPGRDLDILDVSSSEEIFTWIFGTRRTVRVILHATLVPRSARARTAPVVR